MSIEHERMQELLHAYIDGELDLLGTRELEQHLQDCETCRRTENQLRDLRTALTRKGTAFRAPAHLRRTVRAALQGEARPDRELNWPSLVFAAGALCAVVLVGVILFGTPRAISNSVVDQAVDNHVRSLLAAHLLDVRSSDQHTVKPWFDGKIDFAPPVRDLTGNGFPLAGGRLDYLDGKTVAALIYQRNKHPINLFIAPAAGDRDVRLSLITRRGYNVVRWTRGEMKYWAVSDLNADELRQFADLLWQ